MFKVLDKDMRALDTHVSSEKVKLGQCAVSGQPSEQALRANRSQLRLSEIKRLQTARHAL